MELLIPAVRRVGRMVKTTFTYKITSKKNYGSRSELTGPLDLFFKIFGIDFKVGKLPGC